MLDDIIQIGIYFDWISPILELAQSIANGPSQTLLIPKDCNLTGNEIAHILRKHGIKSWGHMVVAGRLRISVKREQAKWAEYVLAKEGIETGNIVPAKRCGTPPEENEQKGKENKRSPQTGNLRSIGDERVF